MFVWNANVSYKLRCLSANQGLQFDLETMRILNWVMIIAYLWFRAQEDSWFCQPSRFGLKLEVRALVTWALAK